MSAPDLVAEARAGRELRYRGAPPPPPVAERMLEPATALMREAQGRNPGLAELDFDAALGRLEHVWLPHRGELVHVEAHPVDPEAPTFVVIPGLGDHARRHLGFATALAERGLNSLVVDRRGHGISEGRRGDAPLETDLAVAERALALARERSSGPVILVGDSLGGIIAWYLLTREPDVDAVICHCIGHPEVHHDASFRFKAPVLRLLGTVLPQARISVRQIADYEQVAIDPHTRRYFEQELDPLFNFAVSARSASSYLGFRPARGWATLTTPALVVIGADDRMVTPEFTRRSLERDRPRRAEYLEIAGAGHQLFLDDLALALDPLVSWAEQAVGVPAPTA